MLEVKLSEYLLIIEPDEQAKTKVFGFKYQFSILGCENSFNLIPHLTISNFLLHPNIEEQLVSRLGNFLEGFSALTVLLNGFETFTNKTIVVKVDNPGYLIHLVSRLKNRFYTYLKSGPNLKPHFSLRPHVTIARQITPNQHKLLWPKWKDKQFTHSFYVQKLKLMKREVDPISLKPLQSYQHVQYFVLVGKDSGFYKQGNLFE
ncbi:MAG: 2'-5' RNA ligase family protein [Pedobacter sp.]|nr:2'-5' RNA ligase family protein [Pedobacter sp.]